METMEAGYNCLKLAEAALGKTNTSCISDFGSAVLCALASVRSAWLNVKINLSGLKDEEYKEKTSMEAHKILSHSEELAEELYKKIEKGI